MSDLGLSTGFQPLAAARDHDETQPMPEDALAAATIKFNLEMPVHDDGNIPLTQPEKEDDGPEVGYAPQVTK